MLRLVALLLSLTLSPCVARAGDLTSATLSWSISNLPSASFAGAGATGTATSSLAAGLVAGTSLNGAFTATIPTSATPPLTAIQVIITKNAGATFVGTAPSKVGGNLSVQGVANVYGIGGFPNGGVPLFAVPLNIGTPNTVQKFGGGVSITSISAGWTAGTAVVAGIGDSGTSTATAMGSNGLTPGGEGTLVLVTPTRITAKRFSATRPCWSKGNGGCDDSMKLRVSSRGCEARPARGEPARAGSEPGDGLGNATGEA